MDKPRGPGRYDRDSMSGNALVLLRLNTSPPSYLTIIKPRVYYPTAYLIYFRFRIMCVSPVRYIPDLASPLPTHIPWRSLGVFPLRVSQLSPDLTHLF